MTVGVNFQCDQMWNHLEDTPPGTPVGGISEPLRMPWGIVLIILAEMGRLTLKVGSG